MATTCAIWLLIFGAPVRGALLPAAVPQPGGALLGAAALQPAGEPQTAAEPAEIVVRDWLVIEPVGRSGREALHTDAIEAQIVAGDWKPPSAGDQVTAPDGEVHEWRAASAGDDGVLSDKALHGGYAYAAVESETERVMLLEAAGQSMVYVNGRPRVGDPYSYGWARLPVKLSRGANHLLFACSRGRLRAKLTPAPAGAFFNTRDPTLPDLLIGESQERWGGVIVVNATDSVLRGTAIEATLAGAAPVRSAVPDVIPMSTRKVPFRIPAVDPESPGEVELTLRLVGAKSAADALDTTTLKLRALRASDKHKRTFISDIDGSVQYFAITPMHPADGAPAGKPALVLTLHGASVEAMNQAAAYDHKDWTQIVAPTNRRPYGFDWEDWGRRDAIEVLDLASRIFDADPQRTYLTGHSMGGHGTWQVGVTLPDRFAAIAPSAGWISFWSYAGTERYGDATPIEAILRRATNPSDTLALSRNLLQFGIYILHGDADDNVPVEQARKMRAHLGAYHPDWAYYERPGAGHWWGNECVDWPPLFEFLRDHVRTARGARRHIEFATANPSISARSDWLTIESQVRPLEISSATVDLDPAARRFAGKTDNVARLAIDLVELSKPQAADSEDGEGKAATLPAGEPVSIELDDQTLEHIPWPTHEPRIYLARDGDEWRVGQRPSPDLKGPERYGPFKEAFGHRFVLVYGTQGSEQENAWAFGKARYDAETFWYRGNGATDVVADTEFDAKVEPDRSVILYGNAETNGAWAALLAGSPVQVSRGAVTIGDGDTAGAAPVRRFDGDDLACLFVRPRRGSDVAMVGVVSGSGVRGMRLTDRCPYFVSGVAYPDCIVMGPEMLSAGVNGVRAAGFFGADWRVVGGDFAWGH